MSFWDVVCLTFVLQCDCNTVDLSIKIMPTDVFSVGCLWIHSRGRQPWFYILPYALANPFSIVYTDSLSG